MLFAFILMISGYHHINRQSMLEIARFLILCT